MHRRPEAVFGQMKTDKQYKRFRHRGFSKIQMDFDNVAMAFNLQKLLRKVPAEGIEPLKPAKMGCQADSLSLVLAAWTILCLPENNNNEIGTGYKL